MNDADLWTTVVGQSAAVDLLRTAVASPVHAYLFVGPDGAGRAEAARAFAGSLFAEGADSDRAARHRRLAAAGSHPDLVLVEPEGRALLIADARRVITEGWRSPVEADRKVIVVDRFDTAEPETAESSSPARALVTSSSTAAAANPPMPRSVNSPSAGITARSV